MNRSDEEERISGILVRGAGGFLLRTVGGRLVPLELQRVPVNEIEKQVTLTGMFDDSGVFQVSIITGA